MTRAESTYRLQYHRGAAVRRWVPRLLTLWGLAFGAAIVAALVWQEGSRTGLVLAIGLVVAAVVTAIVAVRIRNHRPVRIVRWAGVPGASGLEVVDGHGRSVAAAGDVRTSHLVRWSIPSRLGRTDGLALKFASPTISLGARVRDGANVSGSEPLGEPCEWIVPAALWAELERAVRPGQAGQAPEPRARGKRRSR